MHSSPRICYGAAATAGPTNHPPASSAGHVGIGTRVLLVTRDRDLSDRLVKSLSDFAGDTLTVEFVDRVSDATQRLKQDGCVDAVVMDWDLPATRGFETLLLLLGAAPRLPIIILGDDSNSSQQMNLVEHGAQDYLLKRRLDADTLIGMVHSAIARKSRERILFSDKRL
jgi:two-component system, cell cycle sensor histidine kinase and response regulator CckA